MSLSVFGDTDGKTVDWWFIYKLPDNVSPSEGAADTFGKTTGWEYLYFDAESTGSLALSARTLDRKTGELHRTLQQLYKAETDSGSSLGWICYNDEVPAAESNSSSFGHTKGVLAFDLASDTAFWLLHSWPKFPNIETGELASSDYGQTYLCIALASVDTARYIAEQMYHRQEPQTYQNRLPSSLNKDDIFYKVANAVDVNETDPPCDINFLSKGGQEFRLLAKNRHWHRDFWIDLVGPHLKTNMAVETWRRGTVPDTEDSNEIDAVEDVLYINLEPLQIPYEWHYTKDHSKWGISETEDWVCIADINRQIAQEKRGGGSICFRNRLLRDSLSKIERLKK